MVPSPKFHWKFVPAGLVFVKVTPCGAHPVVGFAVNEGTGVGRMVICFEVDPEQPRLVFCAFKPMVYVPGDRLVEAEVGDEELAVIIAKTRTGF